MPYPLPLTRTEAYLAYKAGVIQQSDLKPSLAVPRNGIDAWLAYWTGIAEDYPKREDGTPHILQEEEAYIAYLSGVINEYPEKCLRRVGAYLRYLISARWGRPDHPLNREELYLSLIKTQFIPSGDPSSDIVIDGTAKAPFVDVKVYGDTFQQTYEGKNLLSSAWEMGAYSSVDGSKQSDSNTYRTSEKIAVQPNTTYIVSRNSAALAMNYYEYDANGDYVAYVYRAADQPITTGNTTKFITMSRGLTGGIERIMLERGSAITKYEPYVGGVYSPNIDFPQAINAVTGTQMVEITGKNLFDKSDQSILRNKRVSTSNGGTYNENGWSVSPPIKVKSGETYTVGGVGQTSYYCWFKDGVYISGSGVIPNGHVIAPSGANQIRFDYPTANEAQIQFELGSTATTYAPYSKQNYQLDLGDIELCKIGTYQDYIYKSGDDWKVHKATSKYTFDGSEAWTWDTARIPRLYLTSGALAGLGIHAKMPPDSTTMPVGLTNRFIAKPFTNFYTDNESDGFAMSTSGQNFQIGDKNWTQRTEAEAAANGLIWYHVLATGYETDTIITNQALIDQLNALKQGGAEEGTTYIKVSATDPNLPAKLYVEAPKYD